MYTLENTISEIMRNDLLRERLEFAYPQEFLKMVPRADWDLPLEELPKRLIMPWGVPYLSELLVESANYIEEISSGKNYHMVPLWCENEPEVYFPAQKQTKAGVTILKSRLSDETIKPAALICPGEHMRMWQ